MTLIYISANDLAVMSMTFIQRAINQLTLNLKIYALYMLDTGSHLEENKPG